MLAERLPAMWGRMTAAMAVSSTSMKVGRITAAAISQGLQSGHQSAIEVVLAFASGRTFSRDYPRTEFPLLATFIRMRSAHHPQQFRIQHFITRRPGVPRAFHLIQDIQRSGSVALICVHSRKLQP